MIEEDKRGIVISWGVIIIVVLVIAVIAGGMYSCSAKEEDPDSDSGDQAEDAASVGLGNTPTVPTACNPTITATGLKRTVTAGNEYVLSKQISTCSDNDITYSEKLKNAAGTQQVSTGTVQAGQSITDSRTVTSGQDFTEYCVEVTAPGSLTDVSSCSAIQDAGTTTSSSGSFTVFMANNEYSPPTIVVPLGSTVTWVNRDTQVHQLTGSEFTSGSIAEGETFDNTFNTAGTHDYYDENVPTMRGQVIVTA